MAFVRLGSPSSEEQLEALGTRRSEDGSFTVAVVEGLDAEGAEALRAERGLDFAVVGDPGGRMAERLGVSVSPTVITLDAAARVTGIATGREGLRPKPGKQSFF